MLCHSKVDHMEFFHWRIAPGEFKYYPLLLSIHMDPLLQFSLDRMLHVWQNIHHIHQLTYVSFVDRSYGQLSARMPFHNHLKIPRDEPIHKIIQYQSIFHFPLCSCPFQFAQSSI